MVVMDFLGGHALVNFASKRAQNKFICYAEREQTAFALSLLGTSPREDRRHLGKSKIKDFSI